MKARDVLASSDIVIPPSDLTLEETRKLISEQAVVLEPALRPNMDAMAELPTGTVTFLFSDIEGSTRLLRELGERYGEVLDVHRRCLRSVFAAHGGVEVDTQGDAFFVAFARATDAAAAAREAQDALGQGPVSVRMGLHTGAPRATGGGYVGMDVHRGARIAAAAHGGQIVLSRATRELLDPSVPVGDLGDHRLKDLEQPERLFQLGGGEFPPLRTLAVTNLPVPTTAFVGRKAELAAAAALLEETRLLTVLGPGGSGKTRFALELARDALARHPNGVFFVPLAPIRDAALVLPAIARALGIAEESGRPLARSLAAHLGGRRALLVLDNLEQLLAVAPELSALLESSEGPTMLATSREPLRVRGEVEYDLPPLAEDESVELFVRRARAVGIKIEPGGAVEELAAHLDGLPLALELAAARTKLLTPEQLLDRLGGRLDMLSGGRDAEDRQRTLRATIAWSYDLLDADERRLFARLSVFTGFTLSAAEIVCDADVETMESLLDKSLLRRRVGAAEPRFWMLETIREYATERLDESGELEGLRRRHADHFLSLAEEAVKVASGGEQALWWARLDADHDNLRAALAWCASTGEIETELRLANALYYFWIVRGYLAEGRRWLEAAIARSEAAPRDLRASALYAAGGFAYRQGDYERSRALFESSLGLYGELGDHLGTAMSVGSLANLAVAEGEYEAAMRGYEEARAMLQELGDRSRLAQVVANMGSVANIERRFELARSLGEEALALQRELGNSEAATISLHNLGRIDLRTGRVAAAAELFRECLESALELEYPEMIAYGLQDSSEVAASEGDPDRAARLLGAADALFDELGVIRLGDEVESHDETVRVLEELLGVQAFEAARAEGRAMKLDQAVADAIETTDTARR